MGINAIERAYQNPVNESGTADSKRQVGENAEVNKLNAEIKQTETEMKETMKQTQKATEESIDGSSEKVQMLQNKMLMQQQEILTKQLQIKKIKQPAKPTAAETAKITSIPPRFDRYITGAADASESDNVYRLESKDSVQKIVFNRSEDMSEPPVYSGH